MQAPVPQQRTGYAWMHFFIGLAVLVNFSGLFVHLMDPDAGVYASVSKNMVINNDYVNLHFQGQDWLDKPHFPFWITAFFFKAFGMHDWSYKLPGILFVMLGAFYTYLFTKKYYSNLTALWAVFILLTAQHILISNNDVRAEPFLTGLIIAAIYHFSNSFSKKVGWHLVAGCFFAACAMMTKGLFTLIPVGGAVLGELLFKKQWKQIFNWRWLVALLFLAIFITPELYSLWVQFDRHPEKIIFGKTGVSGIKFFLWDSQFGRFLNTGPIRGKGDPFFFIHTLLWAFLPWAFLMFTALYLRARDLFSKTGAGISEAFTFSGSLLTLLVFSLSKFQLPYYTNIIFPLLSVLTAHALIQFVKNDNPVFKTIQNLVAYLVIALAIGLAVFYRPHPVSILAIVLIALFFLVFISLPRIARVGAANFPYLRSGIATLLVTLFFNLVFYPDLLKYQSGNEAAFFINKYYPGSTVGRLGFYMPSGEFYLARPVTRMDTASIAGKNVKPGGLLFVTEDELAQLKNRAVPMEILKEFQEYHVTMLTLKFLDPKTRQGQLKRNFLLKLL